MTEDQSSLPTRARAYSYLRFSTPEQLEGDSLRRQTTLAADYAARHGLQLDDQLSYQDLGVSAFRGGNISVGRLGEFREAVRVGEVPTGSYLLVESLDRISRDHAFDAQSLLSDMIRDGITVVTLLDERVYSLEGLRQDPMGMMYSIMGFMRANEESAVKSRRLKQAWQNKRAAIGSRPLTSRAPAWLRLDPETGFQVIPERAALVERTYTMTLAGVGQHKIAETFNQEGIATWGRGKHWHRSYIAKVLKSPAVIGDFTPHVVEHQDGAKRRRPTAPVRGYFPPAISEELYADVQALLAAHRGPRGRQAYAPISSILAGLAACPKCGATMTRVQKGKKSHPALVCTRAKAGAGCEYKSVKYQPLEDRLLRELPAALRIQEGMELPNDLDAAIWNYEQGIPDLRDEVDNLLDAVGERRSPALRERLAQKEAALEEAEEYLKVLLERRDIASSKLVASRIERALAALQSVADGEVDRAEVNRALRALFKRAVINWPRGSVDLEWIAGGECRVQVAGQWISPAA